MYSKKSWGGKVEPFILVKFIKNEEKNKGVQDPTVGVVIFEWGDSPLLGKPAETQVRDDRLALLNTRLNLLTGREARVLLHR